MNELCLTHNLRDSCERKTSGSGRPYNRVALSDWRGFRWLIYQLLLRLVLLVQRLMRWVVYA